MANMLDYLDWRGDLTLQERPFNPVDNLMLAELCYLDFSGIVPAGFTMAGVSLRDAARVWLARDQGKDLGLLLPEELPVLLEKLGQSRRFSTATLCGYTSKTDTQAEIQFSALTLCLADGSVYVAFRGTDDTLVGWKEDCYLAISSRVPAQTEALAYFQGAAASFPVQPIRVGGHSKGGNLAVYAAVYCGRQVQDQIIAVYNNDGPGFHTSLLEMEEHRRIASRICTIVPESSVIGMLLEHEEAYAVVRSSGIGLFQHNGFSWQVMGDDFVPCPEEDPAQRLTAQTLRTAIRAMDRPQREAFVEALFEVLTCTDAETLLELKKGGLKTASAMFRAFQKLDKPARQALSDTMKLLVKSGAQSVQDDLLQKERGRTRQLYENAALWLDSQAEKYAGKAAEKVAKAARPKKQQPGDDKT